MQVSFRHAVWPDDENPDVADRIWGSEVHPDWQVHQLLADVTVYYLQKSYARFLEVTSTRQEATLYRKLRRGPAYGTNMIFLGFRRYAVRQGRL